MHTLGKRRLAPSRRTSDSPRSAKLSTKIGLPGEYAPDIRATWGSGAPVLPQIPVAQQSLRPLARRALELASRHAHDFSGEATTATFTHEGSSAFSIWAYGDQPTELINERGAHAGLAHLRASPELISIRANGHWTIQLKLGRAGSLGLAP